MMKRVTVVVVSIALFLILGDGSARACRAAPSPSAVRTAVFSRAGLPDITYGFDRTGRLVDVGVDGTIVATYEWQGSLPTVRLGKWQIETESVSGSEAIQQTARGPNGKIIRSNGATVNGTVLSRPSALLDSLASELHLPGQWQAGLHSYGPDAAELDLGPNRSLKFHMRTVSPGQRIAVEDVTGRTLFWDMDLPVDIPSQFNNFVPTRLAVTASGSVELAVGRPFPGAVDAVWMTHQSDRTLYSVRFVEASGTTPVAQAINGKRLQTAARSPHGQMMAQCGYTTTTTYWDYAGGSYCEVEVWPVYCDYGGGNNTPPPDDGSGGSPIIAPLVTVAFVDTTDPTNPVIGIDVQARDGSHPPQVVLLIVNGATRDSSSWYGSGRYQFNLQSIDSFGDGSVSIAGRSCAASNACAQDTKQMTRYTGSPLLASTTLSASWQEEEHEGPVTHSASYGHAFRQSYTTTTFSGGIESGQNSHFQLRSALATINGDPSPIWNANATAHASSTSTSFLSPSDNPVDCSSGCTSRGTNFGMFGYAASVDEQITSFVVDGQGTMYSGGALSLTMQ